METTKKTEAAKRPTVSWEYLDCLQREFNAHEYGSCTRDMLVDWLQQNAPKDALTP